MAALVLVASCGGEAANVTSSLPDDATADSTAGVTTTSSGEPTTIAGDELYPDVVDVAVFVAGETTYDFDVTLSSPYDSPERYADAWRVRDEDGTVFGVRELAHDHANEQPFTRSLSGVEIPDGVEQVVVEGRDQVNGWGGETLTVDLPDN